MNQLILDQKAIKAKLRVTITPNMSAEQILEAWDRIPDQVKSLLPGEVRGVFSTVKTALTLANTLRTTTVVAKETYNKVSKAIELASIPAGTTQVVPLAAAEAANLAEKVQDKLVQEIPSRLMSLLLSAL